ncbi:MAG: protein kinase [Verrucomicrobiaceae bacterium]
MADDSFPSPSTNDTPPQRTTSGGFRWEPPTAEELQNLMPGYTIEKILGRGGMGAVYRGIQTNLDRPVAIKILPPGVEKEDPSFAERFKNEAKLMAKLNHPGVVAVHDFGTTLGGQLYFAMEYVDGTDVAQMISAQGRLPPEHALAITAHVCDALQAAHELGIVHRDIKPANILINMKGQVKVADFGLAKVEEPGTHGLTKTGYAMGTPDFVSPEALMLGTQIDGRADLYAVGVMLYQMLTGNIPRGAFKPASVLVPGLDPRFDPIIFKAMQHDREERHQSAAELRRELDVILTVPLVRNDVSGYAAVPAAQMAQAPRQRSAPQKPMGRAPQPRASAAADTSEAVHGPSREAGARSAGPRAKSSNAFLYIAIGLAVAVAIGAFVLFSGGRKNTGKTITSSPAAKTQTTAPAASSSAKKTLDLLALADPAKDGISGDWSRRADGVAVKASTTSARLQLPYVPPREYDFIIDFTGTRGTPDVTQILCADGRDFMWKMAGSAFGFELVDGQSFRTNKTQTITPWKLEMGVRHTAILAVRKDGVTATVDGNKVIEFKTDFKNVGSKSEFKLNDPRLLGLGAWKCEVTFHRAEVREISGKGTLARSTPTLAAPKGGSVPAPAPSASPPPVASVDGASSGALPRPDGKPADMTKPVQVFIMMGDGAMLGTGSINPENTRGTLSYLTKKEKKYPHLLDDQGKWTKRNDVRYAKVVHFPEGSKDQIGWLAVGGPEIGPELQIGHILGQALDAPVLLLKSCNGNRSLGWDLLPPGSERFTVNGTTYAGYKDTPEKWVEGQAKKAAGFSWYAGKQFDMDVARAKAALASIGDYYPGARDYQIAGFIWWQGYRDQQDPVYQQRHEQNLANLIKAVRKEFNAPDAPFVLATVGIQGWTSSGPWKQIAEAQLAVGDPGKHPEFAGRVKTVEVRDFWRGPSESPGGKDLEFQKNAGTYMDVGNALGWAMLEFLKKSR